MPEKRDDPDWLFKNHPDLIDPEWEKKAKRATRRYGRRRNHPADWLAARSIRPPTRRARAVMIVVVVVIAGIVVAKHPWTSTPAAAFGPAPLSVPLSVPVTTPRPAPLDLKHPFANTPAANWRDGAAGIALPAAKAVGPYSATQVAADEAKVKQVLIAAHLTPAMLFNRDTTAYLALFAPEARTFERRELAASHDRFGGITVLAKGFSLLPVPVKVSGTMSASLDKQGNVDVHTNYVFAFPFQPTGDPALITQAWQIVAVQHVQEDFEVITGSRYRPSSLGVWMTGSLRSYYGSMACRPAKQGYLAPAFSELDDGKPDAESPYAYYDVNHSMDIGQC